MQTERDSSLYRGCRLADERGRRVKVERLDDGVGYSGAAFLVNVGNDAEVVRVSPLHLLAADTMMRRIVKARS